MSKPHDHQMDAYKYLDSHPGSKERLAYVLAVPDEGIIPVVHAYLSREHKLDDPVLLQRLTARLGLGLDEDYASAFQLVDFLLMTRFFASGSIPIPTTSAVVTAALAHDKGEPMRILYEVFSLCSDMFTTPTLAKKKVQVLSPAYLLQNVPHARRSFDLLVKLRAKDAVDELAIAKARGQVEFRREKRMIEKQKVMLKMVEDYILGVVGP